MRRRDMAKTLLVGRWTEDYISMAALCTGSFFFDRFFGERVKEVRELKSGFAGVSRLYGAEEVQNLNFNVEMALFEKGSNPSSRLLLLMLFTER